MEKKEFTLGTLIQLNIVNYQEQIQNISTTASQERMLTDQLTLIENQWNIKKFNVQPKEIGTTKDTYAITEFEDLFVDLDEALASMNNIIGSRYVKRLQKRYFHIIFNILRADEMKSKLDILQDTTEEWKLCQQNWIYLANIFLSKDIRDNVKSVFQSFEKIDKNWRITMRKVNQKPGVLGYATKKFLQEIKKYNKEMDKIQKDLEAYLESKRKDFPRFYFLSNDELLQILAHSNSIHAGEQHLNKCFDNIAKFELIPDQQNPTGISAMISAEGEVIKLIRDIKLRSQDGIVIWLQEVEKQMVLTLQRNIKVGLNEYYANEGERKDWVLSHSAQIVSVVANIIWTESCEYFINEMQENINALIELYESAVTQLMQVFTLQNPPKPLNSSLAHRTHNRATLPSRAQNASFPNNLGRALARHLRTAHNKKHNLHKRLHLAATAQVLNGRHRRIRSNSASASNKRNSELRIRIHGSYI